MATANDSWASWLMEPYDMAPVLNRFMIASTGSTSSRGTGSSAGFRRKSPLKVHSLRVWSLTRRL